MREYVCVYFFIMQEIWISQPLLVCWTRSFLDRIFKNSNIAPRSKSKFVYCNLFILILLSIENIFVL
jgi:hypothetical protein